MLWVTLAPDRWPVQDLHLQSSQVVATAVKQEAQLAIVCLAAFLPMLAGGICSVSS